MGINDLGNKGEYGKMQYEILYRGTNSMLKVNLSAGESVKAESGAMVAMSSTIEVDGKLEGGLMGGFGRMLSGEKFFFQTLTAAKGAGEALLSPATIGDLQPILLDGMTGYVVQKDGFFAGTSGLNVSTKLQNLSKGIFSGEGFFVIKVDGNGILFVSSYGAIHPIDVASGEEIVIDNGHLVAWPETMSYSVEKAAKGWVSSITSGEGLVCRFRGPGRIYIQTRNPKGFGEWVKQFIPGK